MTQTAIQERFEDLLSRIRQPARLLGGETGAGPGFGQDPGELRVVLGFPDTYEIGISNQALQILYDLAGSAEGVAVERVYLPWVDAIGEMRTHDIPLLTLETWTPVNDTDLLAVTLQQESAFTNLLEMLDLARVPVRAADRGEDHPLVVAGGPACANFAPVEPFLDVVAVGDGEELFVEILTVLERAKREGAARADIKRRLALVTGVYVPGVSTTVARRTVRRLEQAPYPAECLVPLTAGVHDRAWVEVMRGCARGCRFCQAGMWYRPVRERSAGAVMALADGQLAASGHQEVVFASLSTTDYSCLTEVLVRSAKTHPEVRVSLPSLRVDGAAVRLARLASPTGSSLTLAPEAGSQRMRDIINKNVTEDDIFTAAEEALRAGRTTLKLYFMIGLPFEEDADVAAIADLCLAVRERGRSILGSRAGRLQLNISVNNFVPKPHTPFQWVAMAERDTLLRRQELLRRRLRRAGVRVALADVDKSCLEAALARGGKESGPVIERAWRAGARFDSWTEHFRAGAWRAAFETLGTTPERLATSAIPHDAVLPWDVIEGAVDKAFLLREWERARRGEVTPDCRWGGCSECGVCGNGVENELAEKTVPGAAGTEIAPPAAEGGPAMPVPPGRLRYVVTFSVTGRGRFVGHLDRLEILRRAVRRAGGRLALSAGMRPKPLLSLALPLAVGVEGLREMGEFALAEEPPAGFAERLAAALPLHMQMLDLSSYHGPKPLAARVTGALYEVRVQSADGVPDGHSLYEALSQAAARFSACGSFLVEERREGRVRTVDVRRHVERIVVRSGPGSSMVLRFRAALTEAGSVRPARVVEALAELAGTGLETESITRTALDVD